MNREIKFRVWTGAEMEYKVMVGFLGSFYVQGIDPKDTACMSPFNTKYPDNCPVMQFTGLLDKNSKEIYEGDIVRCGYGTGSIIFHAACFMIEWIDDVEADMEFVFSRKGRSVRIGDECLEIIGNLYQNPELIISN